MVKTTIYFDITCQRRAQRLTTRGNPIQDGSFQTLGVVRPRAASTFLNLHEAYHQVHQRKPNISTNELSDMYKFFIRAFHYAIFKAWYNLKKLLKYPVFPAFPE